MRNTPKMNWSNVWRLGTYTILATFSKHISYNLDIIFHIFFALFLIRVVLFCRISELNNYQLPR